MVIKTEQLAGITGVLFAAWVPQQKYAQFRTSGPSVVRGLSHLPKPSGCCATRHSLNPSRSRRHWDPGEVPAVAGARVLFRVGCYTAQW